MRAAPLTAEKAYSLLEAGCLGPAQTVRGVLDFSLKSGRTLPSTLPNDLTVDVLNFTGQPITELPSGLKCYELVLSRTPIVSLPDDLQVRSRLDLSHADSLERLPDGLTVGTLVVRSCTALRTLPEGLDVWFLDLTGCWAFETWPRSATIRSGRLQLQGCTAIVSLPHYLTRIAALNVRDCPNLTSLPRDMTVTGWIDVGRSGLTEESMLPEGLRSTQIRWAGVNVDRRVAFHPESIRVEEVLGERNAERRRVMLDRYGYGRFLEDSNAEILDRDRDPGGPRQLMRVALEGDEDLVALSCFCPSTGRQYIIRVPPTTPTCRHAAAWIAGFDHPDDYQPILET